MNCFTNHLNTIENKNVIAFLRRNGNNEVLVLLNFSNEKIAFEIQHENLEEEYMNVFSRELTELKAGMKFELQPWGFLVYEK